MGNKNIDLSIIIPVYNGEKTILECLNSILIDDSVSYEVLVINDGSNDKTLEIMNTINNRKIKIINNNFNSGVSYSRNIGIDNAQGEWLMFVDADDKLSIGWGEKVKKWMLDNFDMIAFSSDESAFKIDVNDFYSISNCILGNDHRTAYLSSPFSKLFKKQMLIDNKILFDDDIMYGEDMIFVLKMTSHSNRIKIAFENIYLYRTNQSSVSHKYNESLFDSDLMFHKKLKHVLKTSPKKLGDEENYALCKVALENAVFNLMRNLSYCESFHTFNQNISKLNKLPYSKATFLNANIYRKVAIFLLKNKYNRTLYLLLLLKKSIKRTVNFEWISI